MVCTQGGIGLLRSSRCWSGLLLLAISITGPALANAQKPETEPSATATSPTGVNQTGTDEPGADETQKDSPDGDKKPGAKPTTFRGRLPNQYGKLGISSEQRKRIYAVQGETRTQIMQLEQQIERLRQEEQQRVEAVLSAEQLALLKQLRAAARERLNSRKSTSRN